MDHTGQRRSPGRVCSQCRQQKQKCDRQTPCSNCCRRRIPHLCHPASAAHAGTPLSASRASAGRASTAAGLAAITPSPPPSSIASATRPRVGHIWNSRGAPSYHSESYFGPQAVAGIMQVDSPELPASMMGVHLSSSAYRRSVSNSHHGALSLHAHLWELLGHVPRPRAVADAMVQRFFQELNEAFDGLHRETFMSHYEAFWQRRWGDDDVLAVDLRWLALLFMVLAFGELLCQQPDAPAPAPVLPEHEETSLQFFWAARKCLVIAPTFSGESADLVRAGILITRYLIFAGRKAEAWLTNSFAVRMAQAQGMHVDGANWKLPQEVCETRRRLWATLYTLDRTLALALGRPYVIHDKHCIRRPRRADSGAETDAGMDAEEVRPPGWAPDPGHYLVLQQDLCYILGQIQDECFGLTPAYQTYETVLRLDGVLLAWAERLPAVFRLQGADVSMDAQRPYLYWQRIYLHAQFNFARIALHRPFVVLDSATDRFRFSRDTCMASACADLQCKFTLGLRHPSIAGRLKASIAAHNLANSALVLGVITVRAPLAPEVAAVLADLQAYCQMLRSDAGSNDFLLAEVRVVELCMASAYKAREAAATAGEPVSVLRPSPTSVSAQDVGVHVDLNPEWRESRFHRPTTTEPCEAAPQRDKFGYDRRLDGLLGPTGNFPEPVDFDLWEDLVGSLENRL